MIGDRVVGQGIEERAKEQPRQGRRIALLALVGGLLVLALAAVCGYELAYQGRVYAGVSVAGHDLGGMQAADVRDVVAALDLPGGPVVLGTADGQHTWTYARRDLGVAYDADAVADAALAYGRSGNLAADLGAQWTALLHGVILATPLRLDAAALPPVVAQMAAQVDQAPVVGRLDTTSGSAVIVAGQPGVALDRPLTVRLLQAVLAVPRPAPELALPVVSVANPDDMARLAATRDAGQALATAPITVHIADRPTTFTLALADLQKALVWSDNGPAAPTAHLDSTKIRALLAPLAAQVQVAPQDATLQLVHGKPTLFPEIGGWALDLDNATDQVLAAANTPDRTVTLPLNAVPAAVSVADLQPVYQQWTALLARGFTFNYGEKSWTLKASKLAGNLALVGNQGGGGLPYRLQLDGDVLSTRIAAIADDVDVSPRDGRYRLVAGAVKVVAAPRDGQAVDQDASLAAAQAALAAGQTTANLVVVTRPAPANVATVPTTVDTPNLLGSAQTTYYGSSPERAHNVEFGTSLVDGALIPPGAEFDLNGTLGPLTLAAGFEMGWEILSNGSSVTTVPAEAGGICQVATTLFQSVYWAGLPITERNHHSYWITSYGKAPSGMQGLDATISPPEKNFRWVNTTGQWILIRAHAAGGVVRFQLWGTDPHWHVESSKPTITHLVRTNTAPIYQQSNALVWGRTLQVEHAQDGFTADIHRQVFDANGTLLDDWHAQGTYLPAHNRFIQGTKGRPKPTPAPSPTTGPPVLPLPPGSLAPPSVPTPAATPPP